MNENKDLLEIDEPTRIPEPAREVSSVIVSKEERRERISYQRKANLISAFSSIRARNAWNINVLMQLVENLSVGDIKGGRLEGGDILVLTGCSEDQIINLARISLDTLGRTAGLFPSARATGTVAFVDVMNEHLFHYGSEQPWLSRRAGDNAQLIFDGQREIAKDAQEIRRMFEEIPLLSGDEVLQVIASSGELGNVDAVAVPSVCLKIRETLVEQYENSNRMFSSSLEDKASIEYWHLKFWQTNLQQAGLSDVQITALFEKERVLAREEFIKRISVLVQAVFGEGAQDWLHGPDRCLEGGIPISLMNSEKGLRRVWSVLNLYAEQ